MSLDVSLSHPITRFYHLHFQVCVQATSLCLLATSSLSHHDLFLGCSKPSAPLNELSTLEWEGSFTNISMIG